MILKPGGGLTETWLKMVYTSASNQFENKVNLSNPMPRYCWANPLQTPGNEIWRNIKRDLSESICPRTCVQVGQFVIKEFVLKPNPEFRMNFFASTGSCRRLDLKIVTLGKIKSKNKHDFLAIISRLCDKKQFSSLCNTFKTMTYIRLMRATTLNILMI